MTEMIDLKTLQKLQYMGVEVSPQGIASVYGARTELCIPREEVRTLRVLYGTPGERRWLQIPFALALLGLAAWKIVDLITWLFGGGTRTTLDVIVLVVLIGVGGWLLRDATRPQWFVQVETQEKKRNLAFHGKVDEVMLNILLDYARLIGYHVEVIQPELRGGRASTNLPGNP